MGDERLSNVVTKVMSSLRTLSITPVASKCSKKLTKALAPMIEPVTARTSRTGVSVITVSTCSKDADGQK